MTPAIGNKIISESPVLIEKSFGHVMDMNMTYQFGIVIMLTSIMPNISPFLHLCPFDPTIGSKNP
jgi:hypothetical protein